MQLKRFIKVFLRRTIFFARRPPPEPGVIGAVSVVACFNAGAALGSEANVIEAVCDSFFLASVLLCRDCEDNLLDDAELDLAESCLGDYL